MVFAIFGLAAQAFAHVFAPVLSPELYSRSSSDESSDESPSVEVKGPVVRMGLSRREFKKFSKEMAAEAKRQAAEDRVK